ncbi:hypothetical protein NDU88_005945 [Pleurodeles waltl]|uniref:Uncharacterized protein n=1 Tax=Pleurodeles waltl TaxID=8319 RepID=A0AAV7LMN5_PLEWA|nr:hypothetical protein NDU88_005945 [Pleurodeles waltl]
MPGPDAQQRRRPRRIINAMCSPPAQCLELGPSRPRRCPANRGCDGGDRIPEGCRRGRLARWAASRPVVAALGGPAMRPPGLSVEGSSVVRGADAVSARGPGRLDERHLSW